MALIASVIVDVSARAVDRAFDYLVPAELTGLQLGCAVIVDFGNRPVVGYVIGLAQRDPQELGFKLKPLAGVLSEPYFDEVGA